MTKDDTPIIEQDYLHGVKVVDLGDIRIARGKSLRKRACEHSSLVYCESERRIWCKVCESEVSAFDGFVKLVTSYNREMTRLAKLKGSIEKS